MRGRVGALIEVAAGFHPDLTGRENIFLQGAIMGMRRAEIRRRFDEIVDFAGIPDFIDTPVKRYSSGMNARLGFAIAAHLDPDVLLIDEVLAVGDFAFSRSATRGCEEFRRDGIPIAFVSHNMQAIATLCDRVMLLRAGQDPVVGDVASVLSEYVSSRGAPRTPACGLTVTLNDVSSGGRLSGPLATGHCSSIGSRFGFGGGLVARRRPDPDRPLRRPGHFHRNVDVGRYPGHQPRTRPIALRARIAFSANVLRGTYIINFQFVDSLRQWAPAAVISMSTFVVD